MEVQHENFCKNIFYEIHHTKPFEKIRTEWQKFQNSCVSSNTNKKEKQSNAENGSSKYSYSEAFKEDNATSQLSITYNKFSIEISQDADKKTITEFIQRGILNFGIDLFFGSVQQNLELLIRLQEAALEISQNLGFPIPISVYLRLSPRLHYTGKFYKNRLSFNLRLHKRVILTTNRKYASHSCQKIIYVNAKFIVYDLQKCDIIRLGERVELLVIEKSGNDQIICIVIVPGLVRPRMSVTFPKENHWVHSRISAEELEDITFAMAVNINVIVSYMPGYPEYYTQFRETMTHFHCNNYYLFTRLTLSNLNTMEDAKWIANTYDGFILDCSSCRPEDKIVKLSPVARQFMQASFQKRKPVFLHGSWSTYVHSCDYRFAFYYPDKYILPCSSEFLYLFEAVFNKLAPLKCSAHNFCDKSLTGSNTLARSIAAASFDFQADAIVMCTIAGRMATKIAHFRPKTPIIAVTNIKSVLNYTSMHHNICMLLFDANDNNVSHAKDTHQKLAYGVRFAKIKKLVDNNSTIILVYRKLVRYGFTDKFVVIKFDGRYVETIEKAILQK